MAEEASSKKISLKAADGEIFEVDLSITKEMQIIRSFIEDDTATITSTIPLLNIKSRELIRILKYCRMYSDDKGNAKKFDEEFVKEMNIHEIIELLLAANYLNVKKLLDLLSQSIANFIKNKSVEYVRNLFGMVNDFTPEEEARIREENAWAFEGVDVD